MPQLPGTAPWAHLRPVLGAGMTFPLVPPIPAAVKFKDQKDWSHWLKARADKVKGGLEDGGRRGAHDSSKNQAQLYLEDADGVPVAGHIAEEARQLVYSLLWSLMWSGQYASRSMALTYEARVYMHVVLAQNFPMLLYCTGGRWKTDLLISQQYSGFNSIRKNRDC